MRRALFACVFGMGSAAAGFAGVDCNNNGVDDGVEARPVLYVDGSAAGGLGTPGSSWADAYTDLQDALCIAFTNPVVREIWIAEGAYVPGDASDREATFFIPEWLSLYGGFPSGGGDGTFEARDPGMFTTTLSGDLGGADVHAYHVVTVGATVTETPVLDGLVIEGGRADEPPVGAGVSRALGGGVFVANGSIEMRHCVVRDNVAVATGGGVHAGFGMSRFIDCIFEDNQAFRGAGLACIGGAANVENCEFRRNVMIFDDLAAETGQRGALLGPIGALYLKDVNVSVAGCLFEQNGVPFQTMRGAVFPDSSGGALGAEDSIGLISDSTFTGNGAVIGGAVAISYLLLAARGEGELPPDLVLQGCTLEENFGAVGGAVYFANPGFAGRGDVSGFVHIDATTIRDNLCISQGGGIFAADALLRLTASTIERNGFAVLAVPVRGFDFGGGGLFAQGAQLLIEDTVVRENGDVVILEEPARGLPTVVGGGLHLDGARATLLGTTVEQNIAGFGGGIYATQPLFRGEGLFGLDVVDSLIRDNRAVTGGGVAAVFASVNFLRSTIADNTSTPVLDPADRGGFGSAGSGGGLLAELSTINAVNVIFRGNRAEETPPGERGFIGDGGAAMLSDTNARFVNTLFADNVSAGQGGAIYVSDGGGTPEFDLLNCTVAGNQALSGATGGVFAFAQVFRAENTIFAANLGDTADVEEAQLSIELPFARGGDIDVTTCLIEGLEVGGPFDGNGNFDGDPDFVDPAAGIYNLGINSAARDAGNDGNVPSDEFDLDDDGDIDEAVPFDLSGFERFRGASVDIGALEFQAPPRLYVDAGATGLATGETWPDAYLTLSDALEVAVPTITFEIWVAEGMYRPSDTMDPAATFEMVDGVTLLGGFPAGGGDGSLDARDPVVNVTFLSGDLGALRGALHSRHVVTVGPDVRSTIDGVTIQHGYAVLGEGLDAAGAGVLVNQGEALLEQCVLRENEAENGAAAYVANGELTLRRCLVTTNTASVLGAVMNDGGRLTLDATRLSGNLAGLGGGALVNRGATTLVNAILDNNLADFYGGAIYNNTTDPDGLEVYNSTIVDNDAFIGGGHFNLAGDASFANTILSGNADFSGQDEIAQVRVQGGAASADHCIIQGLDTLAGSDNLDADPLLSTDPVGYATPQTGSPAIDAGDDALVPAGVTTDYAGGARFLGTVDIGAVEAQPAADCAGDANGDRMVNFTDLEILLDQWNTAGPEADFDDSGAVDFSDLNDLLDAWNTTCP